MRRSRLHIQPDELARFCRRHHIRRLSFFGSVLRDDFGPENDVDVLVEFEPGHVSGLPFIDVEDKPSQLVGGPVDLATPNSVSRWIRAAVLSEAEVQYAQG